MKKVSNTKKTLSASQREELLSILKARFEKNMKRHKGLDWSNVQKKLETSPAKLWSLNEMEQTGGEPDVVGFDKKANEYFFMIAQPKVRKAAAVFVMIMKHWKNVKNINPKTVLLKWRTIWTLNC